MILLITPPFVQFNTPYPATPILAGFLKGRGVDVSQCDISLQTALRIFSKEGLRKIIGLCENRRGKSRAVDLFLARQKRYIDTVDTAIAFLQGRNDAAAWLIARRDLLPEGPSFQVLEPEGVDITAEENLHMLFGDLGVVDRAKLIASLYLDDIAMAVREGIDPCFGFSRYAEQLAVALPSFDALAERLTGENGFIDSLIEEITIRELQKHKPDIVGITIPFPGTLYSALKIAAAVRQFSPAIHVVIGGGYVNTELRTLTDRRIFDYADSILFDEGFAPWLGVIGEAAPVRTLTRDSELPPRFCCPADDEPRQLKPDYTGLDLRCYFNLLELPNPMHRIWSDGRWIKLQLASGCYWRKCAFCDISLDYIQRYQPPDINELIDCIAGISEETGLSGFHFTDEALSPALIRKLCQKILERGLSITWWGNIRFEKAFDTELASLMAEAGCIAVTGGLECADDRLLKLMNKGITLESAGRACAALSDAGILVHAYLMYGFPTQTRRETVQALEFVRNCFAKGWIQSAYWHRFALTAHSPIAQEPEKYGIELLDYTSAEGPVFAVNEIPYRERNAPDADRLGESLRHALYNYMLGLGLDMPVDQWFQQNPGV